MDFTRPKRCRRQRTGREDRRSNFYEISDNLLDPAASAFRDGGRYTLAGEDQTLDAEGMIELYQRALKP